MRAIISDPKFRLGPIQLEIRVFCAGFESLQSPAV